MRTPPRFAAPCLTMWKYFTIASVCTAPWAINHRLTLRAIIDSTRMKAHIQTNHRKNCLPHLTYSAFSLAARFSTTCFLKLTVSAKKRNSFGPVKHKRALLKNNPPRDSWIEGDEINTVSTFGEANTSPNLNLQTFISEPEHALENLSKPFSKSSKISLGWTVSIKHRIKNYLSSYPFFRSKRSQSGGGARSG